MKEYQVKIWSNYKIAKEIESLLKNKSLMLDDGGMSRNIARTLQAFRDSGKLAIGYDQRLKKSILVINGIGGYKKRRHIGASIFNIEVR